MARSFKNKTKQNITKQNKKQKKPTKTKHSPFAHFTDLQSQELRSSQCPHALKTDSSFIDSLNHVTFIQSRRLHLITPGNSERKGDSISIINPTSHHLLSCFSYPNIYRSHIPTTSACDWFSSLQAPGKDIMGCSTGIEENKTPLGTLTCIHFTVLVILYMLNLLRFIWTIFTWKFSQSFTFNS